MGVHDMDDIEDPEWPDIDLDYACGNRPHRIASNLEATGLQQACVTFNIVTSRYEV
jgi:hypothetical protein